MAKYQLTERQQHLIRLLALGLKNKSAKTVLGFAPTLRGLAITGLNEELLAQGWSAANRADFEAFVHSEFLHPISINSYALNEYLIFKAVEHNFEEEEPTGFGIGGRIMAKCLLTERQKDLIRSLEPGLRDGTLETDWSVFGVGEVDGIMTGINDDGSLWRNAWHVVKWTDFDAFIQCGLFYRKYVLNEAAILDAIDRNFEDEPQVVHSTNHYDFRGSNIHGSILNIASTLNDVQQSISSAPSLSDDAKAQLTQLIGELKDELAKVPEEAPEQVAEDAEKIAHDAQAAIEQLNREKPNKTILKSTVDEFEKGIKNVGRILPPIIAIGAQIATILRPFIG